MSSTRKPKLDYEEQIKKLKSLGILFNEITEEEVEEILKIILIFKLISFRKNIKRIVVEIIILSFLHFLILLL